MVGAIRKPESRTRVIEAAWRVVAAHGVHEATMRRIAAEAGVTTGFVTHYFDDKQSLLADVVRHNNLRFRDRIVGAVEGRRGLVALEGAIEAMLPVDADTRREWQVGVACWGPTVPGAEAAEELRTGWRELERTLGRLLTQAAEDGDLPAGIDVGYESSRLVTLVAGVGMLAGIESSARMRVDVRRMLADHLSALRQTRQGTT
jgi:AcrR family transcriptional regulator